jgi:hypothetical protein
MNRSCYNQTKNQYNRLLNVQYFLRVLTIVDYMRPQMVDFENHQYGEQNELVNLCVDIVLNARIVQRNR